MPRLKSANCETRVGVLFRNKTDRRVDVVWVNYSGDYITYASLDPEETIYINTFKSHPWLFFDSETGDFKCVAKKFVYFPEPMFSRRSDGLDVAQININSPLHSLRTITLLKVCKLLKHSSNINSLPLPLEVKKDLHLVFNNPLDFHRKLN